MAKMSYKWEYEDEPTGPARDTRLVDLVLRALEINLERVSIMITDPDRYARENFSQVENNDDDSIER